MSFQTENPQATKTNSSSFKRRNWSLSDIILKPIKPLKEVLLTRHLNSLSTPTTPKSQQTLVSKPEIDKTLLLNDEVLMKILSRLPLSQRKLNSLVCKRWLNLQGRLVRSLKVFDWEFLESGRLISRFPNLNHVDLINGCFVGPCDSSVCLSNLAIAMNIDSGVSWFSSDNWRIGEKNLLPVEVVDRGLKGLASGCPNLRKLVVVGASELGLLSVAEECLTLQELELHKCNDNVLRGIAAYENLQVLRIVANVDGVYSSLVSDIGLTILAQGCKRLVKLELTGCEGSFDGVKAIGQSCQMLEELTFCDHRMEDGWLAALSYCENLKTLRFVSCRRIDPSPGPDEYLGYCAALERLHLQNCHLRDKTGVGALFKLGIAVRGIIIHDCWGLDNNVFNYATVCRRVKLLSLVGCSLITTEGLESVLLTWNELESLQVESCKNVKDIEVSPALSTLFSVLLELKWKPDTKHLLASSIAGSGMGKKGTKFFKKLYGTQIPYMSDIVHMHDLWH